VRPAQEARAQALLDALLPKLVDYGKHPETSKIRAVYEAYSPLVRETDSEFRLSLLNSVSSKVLEGRISCDAFLPFLFADPDLTVISTAALELAQNSPIHGKDRLQGIRSVYDLGVSSPGVPRLGIFMGLAYMGDRRVYGVLKNCWSLLSIPELKQFMLSRMPALYAGYIDFLVDALEENEFDVEGWGAILGSLCGLPQSFDKVVDLRREIPLDPRKDRQVELIQSWTIPQYGAHLWERLERLLIREPEPKVIPMVMKAWGIQHPDAAASGGRFSKWLRGIGVRKDT
jgi:hypothetical protein